MEKSYFDFKKILITIEFTFFSRDHPLLKLSNVIITPHMGTATHDSVRAMMEDMVQSMMDAVNGHSISYEVTDI